MNKHKYKQRVEELEFALEEKTKEFDCQKGEFGRLKKAYKMSERQIRELQQQVKKLNIDDVSESLEIPDIRNKLSPLTHLIWCAENERGEKHLEKAIPQAKKSINYLAQREVYSR